jgi:hypothetical protein
VSAGNGEKEARAQARREAAPVAVILFGTFVLLAGVSWSQGWQLLGLHWWVWLIVAAPPLLLTVDLLLGLGGTGLVQSREAALALLGLLVALRMPRQAGQPGSLAN